MVQPEDGTIDAGTGATAGTTAAAVLPAVHAFVVLTVAALAGPNLGAAAVVAGIVLTLAALAGTVLGAAAVFAVILLTEPAVAGTVLGATAAVAGAGVTVATETDEALGSGTRRKPRSRAVDVFTCFMRAKSIS